MKMYVVKQEDEIRVFSTFENAQSYIFDILGFEGLVLRDCEKKVNGDIFANVTWRYTVHEVEWFEIYLYEVEVDPTF